MSNASLWAGALIFGLAILHTFSTAWIERLGHRFPAHHGTFHLLAEVEAVFGFWALVLFVWLAFAEGVDVAVEYADTRNYTEPLFVFAIMVVSASRPVMSVARALVVRLAALLPVDEAIARFWLLLTVVPLLGSLITEPAAMTLAAIMLLPLVRKDAPERFKYATLGVLFVNVSIGGTLTHFAAPPVLMVAGTWSWDTSFMFEHIGWKSALAVGLNATALTVVFRRHLILETHEVAEGGRDVPLPMQALHLALVGGIVLFAHHPPVFMGIFLLFMAVAAAYPRHHDRLVLREGLLVASFLAGLVVLGGLQQWWLEPVLISLSPDSVYFGAAALTAITDNAALTYLGSLVPGLSDDFKHALVAGAVAGGGLTVIANAPNPAGAALLRGRFADGQIAPLGLLAGAALPTVVALVCLKVL